MNTVSKQKPTTIRGHLESDAFKVSIARVLPKHLSPDRMARIAITAITRTPKLADCDQASFFRCLMDLSQWGLEPDGRQAHLIPFNNRKRGVVECQLIVDYKGLVELVMRTGKVSSIHADVVCENDVFDYDRGEIVRHTIDFKQPRGEVYAAYALIRFKDGSEKCEVMSKEDIEAIRNRSRAGRSGPWVTDWNEMAKKTAFRRVSKWVSLSAEIRDAIAVDDKQFEGIVEGIVSTPSIGLDDLTQRLTESDPPETDQPPLETSALSPNADPEDEAIEITEDLAREKLSSATTDTELNEMADLLIENGADEGMINHLVGEYAEAMSSE